VKRVTLALAACASIAYRKTPTARNLTDLACLLLATNVLPRPGSRYRTSRLKVLIKYYSALLISLYWLSPTREFVSFLPNAIQLSNIISCSPAGPHHLGGQAAFTKLLKTRNHSRDFQFQADCFCLFSLDSGRFDSVATLNHFVEVVELTGIEPVTSCLQSRRSPN
jgi:hypothetical protein